MTDRVNPRTFVVPRKDWPRPGDAFTRKGELRVVEEVDLDGVWWRSDGSLCYAPHLIWWWWVEGHR